CHWCHVMEHESFEDDAVAALMNAHYTSIKIDREERPDLDARYMSAVQLMTGQGGWPLNVIALPDGTPVWGGTYFSRRDWSAALEQIAQLWREDRETVLSYGMKMQEGLKELV
ncbi:MAG TPA: thioredoxin domain-containing protein, partial [Cryomorphaceae bacterium]|nr:thioredoxin domain-containing protein [Cryomorphaceae bacterium]